ncbi:MAG: hypothetical protein ACI9CA_000448 [Natronomonas sp.]|jgi:hypothetical protein
MDNPSRRRLAIIRQAISDGNIERMYGADMPTFEMLKRLAQTGAPDYVDTLIEEAIAGTDLDFHGLDVPEQEIARVIVLAGYVSGKKVRMNVLLTEVEELVARVDPATATLDTNTASVEVDRSCPECETELGETPTRCPECGWEP